MLGILGLVDRARQQTALVDGGARGFELPVWFNQLLHRGKFGNQCRLAAQTQLEQTKNITFFGQCENVDFAWTRTGRSLSNLLPELKTHNRPAAGSESSTARRSEPVPAGLPALHQRIRAAEHSDDLQWLDAATLDKAVEMKVSFYAAHLKGWA